MFRAAQLSFFFLPARVNGRMLTQLELFYGMCGPVARERHVRQGAKAQAGVDA